MNKKLLFCLIAIILSLNVSAVDICNGDDGCRLAIKTKMMIPLRDKMGESIVD
jgi:hypothetical protein